MMSLKVSTCGWLCRIAVIAGLFFAPCMFAQKPAKQSARKKSGEVANGPERRAARAYESARANPLELHAFLERMPKGGELHYHLTGGVYAETWIRDGAEDGLCVDVTSDSLVQPQSRSPLPVCAAGQVPATNALSDQRLYDALIDAFSMRSFVPTAGKSAHDHFFDTFDKFLSVSPTHGGEWMDEAASRAAAQNEQYLEVMDLPDFGHLATIANQVGWKDDLNQLRTDLLARGLRDDVASAMTVEEKAESDRRMIEHCGQPQEAPACKVTIRFIYFALRSLPKELVFAQTLLGFELASTDPLFVGTNIVRPEDGRVSMEDYGLHMKIIGFLHGLYPKVHISLHAGELAEGLVPPKELCCHIRLAVEQAHAERIGHGVDVMQEDRPYELLKEMAAKHVLVETNLTSNDIILGVSGKNHPLPIYRKYGVPIALSTDDEGVSRIDLTHEFVRAAETYALTYADLKQMVRASLEHAFLPGASLWVEQDRFDHMVPDCAQVTPGTNRFSVSCAVFLKSSEKAQQQWELEHRFHEFEAEL